MLRSESFLNETAIEINVNDKINEETNPHNIC